MPDGQQVTYDVFVKAVLEEVTPLLPGERSPELEFAGSDRADADSATLHCSRALSLESLAHATALRMGLNPNVYSHALTSLRAEPFLHHGAYARNIRRWERGTLPRKRKVRADFVLVATCWLYAWGDRRHACDEIHISARQSLVERLFEAKPARDVHAMVMALVLWRASSDAYSLSMLVRERAS